MTTAEKDKRSVQFYADRAIYLAGEFWQGFLSSWGGTKTLARELKFSWLGFTVIAAGYKRWAVCQKHLDDLNEMRATVRKLGTPPDLKAVERYNAEVRRNRNLSMVLFGIIAFVTLIFWLIYGDNVAADLWGYQLTVFNAGVFFFLAGAFALCDAIGHRYVAPLEEGEVRPISPINPGMTISSIQNSIRDVFKFYATGTKIIGITFHGHRYLGNDGIEFEVHTTDKITREDLEILEKHLQIGKGMAKLMPNKRNTAAPILRIYWSDPLGESTKPEAVEPKSRSIYDKFCGFRDELGRRVGMRLIGSHQFWAGGSGSGKSSALWTLLDFLVDCKDAKVYGIDIGGTVFGPYRRQMKRVATTQEDAEEVLDELIEETERRVAILDARMDAEEEMEDENWPCTEKDGEEAIFLVIDEYSTFAKVKTLREKAARIYETGRKTRVHVIVATPDASAKAMGNSTTPINQAMIKVIFGIPFSMITTIFGEGAIAQGWRPDMFEPAQDGDPGDAGKCMIRSAEFGLPVVQRFDRLDIDDIYVRNRARRSHITGAPTIPEPLMILKAAFGIHGNPEKLKTADILAIPAAAGWTAQALSAALKEAADGKSWIAPAPKPMRFGDKSGISGYEYAAVEAAIKAQR